MPGQQTIDPKAYILTVGPAIMIQFKKGTMITIAYDSPAFTDDVSADGFVTRIKSADMRGSIKFTLDQASPSNDVLTTLATVDRVTGSGVFPVFFKDIRGTSVGGSSYAWIEKLPDAAFGTESEGREWTVRCSNLDAIVGGTIPV